MKRLAVHKSPTLLSTAEGCEELQNYFTNQHTPFHPHLPLDPRTRRGPPCVLESAEWDLGVRTPDEWLKIAVIALVVVAAIALITWGLLR